MGPTLPRRVLEGAGSGVFATLTMSVTMLAAKRAGKVGRLPPKLITEKALDTAEVRRSETTDDVSAMLAHLTFGAGCGGVFALLHPRLPSGLRLPTWGALFATLVWGVSYFGWVPAAGVMPPPQRDRPGRPTSMLVAHWVFGVTLGWVFEHLQPARRR